MKTKVIIINNIEEDFDLRNDLKKHYDDQGYFMIQKYDKEGFHTIFEKYERQPDPSIPFHINPIDRVDYLIQANKIDLYADEENIYTNVEFDDGIIYYRDVLHADIDTKYTLETILTILEHEDKYRNIYVSFDLIEVLETRIQNIQLEQTP